MKTRFKLLALTASLLACGLGVSADAQASAYAFAADNIKNGTVLGVVDGTVLPLGGTSPFISSTLPASTSSTDATLTGTSGAAHSVGGPNPDAPISTLGTPLQTNENVNADGYYNPLGALGTNFSWGDANVVSEQSATTTITARNAAETNVGTTGLGTADGTNASSTVFSLPITLSGACGVTHDCKLDFSFLADPYIFASLDALALINPASFARGTLEFSITLTELGVGTVFSWAPNGVVTATGALGGTELADGENLNLSKEALIPGTFAESSGPYASNVYGSFHAQTSSLGAGAYTLTLRVNEKTEAQRAVPEPASLALLGLGLSGLALVRRRKQA